MLIACAAAVAQGGPDAAAHRAAMEKFRFLAGTWKGEATITAPDGKPTVVEQTEPVEYRLDSVVLVIEGTGRDAAGKVAFNALAVVSFDPASGTYRMRAWNAGNFVLLTLRLERDGYASRPNATAG